jgi:UDP-glucose 4-epimerase
MLMTDNEIRILVTGGAGNVGGSLVRALCKLPGARVLVVDNLQTGSKLKLPHDADNCSFVRADVNVHGEIAPVFAAFHPDYVFHYAATVGVKRTLDNPMMVLADIEGIKHVCQLSKSVGVKRIFYSSSSEVYGEPVEMPQRESSTPLNSRLPYAVVKNIGEVYLRSYQREFALNFTIFRFFNTYGPLQNEDFVVSRFVRRTLRGEPITIYGEGEQTRTFCFVDDSIEFQIRCLTEGHCVNETVNVGSDVEYSVLQLAREVGSVLGVDVPITHVPPLAEGDMTRRQPDNSRMKEILKRDLIPLREGIRRIVTSIDSGD